MSFSELRRRVLTALSVKAKATLSTELGKRISSDPLRFLDPNGASNSERIKVLKHSLYSVLKSEKHEVSLHIIEVLFDFISSQEMPPDPEPLSKPVDKLNSSNSSKPVSSKQKEIKSKVKKVKVQQELPSKPAEVIVSEVMETESGVPPESYTPELPIPVEKVEDTEHVSSDCKTKKRKNKSSRQEISGSVSPATPRNAKVLVLSPVDAQVGTANKVVDPKMVNEGYWTMVANMVEYHAYLDWMSRPPIEIGSTCHTNQIKQCFQCIQQAITTPVTDCDAVGCKNKSHSDGLFPHPTRDFDSTVQHGICGDEVHQQMLAMSKSEMLPSIFYVMEQDKTAFGGKIKPKGRVTSDLKKTVDYIFNLKV